MNIKVFKSLCAQIEVHYVFHCSSNNKFVSPCTRRLLRVPHCVERTNLVNSSIVGGVIEQRQGPASVQRVLDRD